MIIFVIVEKEKGEKSRLLAWSNSTLIPPHRKPLPGLQT
jgi:hypothetical protein